MRLIRPSPGECVDRQTILQLKAEHGQSLDEQQVTDKLIVDVETQTEDHKVARTTLKGASKINIQPFLDEHDMIQRYLEEYYFPNIEAFRDRQEKFDGLFKELQEVNAALWKLEDQARILRDAPGKFEATANQRAAEILYTITHLNDSRARVVQSINLIWNITSQEKLHQ